MQSEQNQNFSSKWGFFKWYGLSHLNCPSTQAPSLVWADYKCMGCGKKAPDHLILQSKLLYGNRVADY